jgi:hypothetical protein
LPAEHPPAASNERNVAATMNGGSTPMTFPVRSSL